MIVKRAKFVLSVVAGLLAALAASNLRAALKVDPVGLVVAHDVDGDDVVERAGEEASSYVLEILKSHKSRGSHGLQVSADGTSCLAPLFPLSSGPADDTADPQIYNMEIFSVPLPGAGAIPASVNGAGSVVSGFAVANKLTAIPQAALQTSLPPVAETLLPTGPPYRFFRPPREDMLSILSYYS